MNAATKTQRGSPSRDRFKQLHKELFSVSSWACDADLELVEKKPIPFIVARLDFKLCTDSVSFSEAIAYQHLLSAPLPWFVPVYVIEAALNFKDEDSLPEEHLFNVYQVLDLDYEPDPPTYTKNYELKNATWKDLQSWEWQLRFTRQRQMATWYSTNRK